MPLYTLQNKSPLFHLSVDKILTSWTALELAVQNGQGGAYGKQIATWMRGAVEDFFYQNDDLMADEVAEFLATIMNQELDTIVDDNSLDEIGDRLCAHFRLAMDPTKGDELTKLHAEMDLAAATVKPPPQHQQAPGDESDSDEGDDDDQEAMETEETGPTPTNGHSSSSSHRTGHNTVTQPDEEGWVTVVKPSKKH